MINSMQENDCHIDSSQMVDCVQSIIRPWRLKGVVTSLSNRGIRGMTVSQVSGIGFQGGTQITPHCAAHLSARDTAAAPDMDENVLSAYISISTDAHDRASAEARAKLLQARSDMAGQSAFLTVQTCFAI